MASTLKVNTIAHSGGTNAITIDSGGRMVQSNRPVFFAQATNSANGAGTKWSTGGTAANSFAPIPFDKEIIDRTNNFDPSTFKFTVPVTGDYMLYSYAIAGDSNEWLRMFMMMQRSSAIYALGATQNDFSGSASTDFAGASMQIMAPLVAGDTVWMTLDKNSSGTEESLYTGSSTITGMTAALSGMPDRWNGFGGYLI